MKNIKSILTVLFLFAVCWNVTAQEVAIFPQLGHSGSINSIAFSPDNKYILSNSDDQTSKLWDINSGRIIRTFNNSFGSVIFSPNGNQILSGGANKIVLYDTNTGNEIWTINDDNYSFVFNSNGRQIIYNGANNNKILIDRLTGREIKTFRFIESIRNTLTFTPDGRNIISVSEDLKLVLWDTVTGQEIRTFNGFAGNVFNLKFSPDGNQVLSYASEGIIKLWDIATGRENKAYSGFNWNGIDNGQFIDFSPDGNQIAALSSSRGIVKIWDIATGREIRTLTSQLNTLSGGTYGNHYVKFSQDGRQILAFLGSKGIIIWDVNSGREIINISLEENNWLTTSEVIFSQDGRNIVFCHNYNVKILEITSGREIRTINNFEYISDITLSPDRRHIITGLRDGTIDLFDNPKI